MAPFGLRAGFLCAAVKKLRDLADGRRVVGVNQTVTTEKHFAMKKSITPQLVGLVLSLAATLVWVPQTARAENTPQPTAQTTPTGYDLEIKDGQLVSLGNGRGREATLGNVVDALRDRYTKANLVLAPGLAKIKIADLKLRAGNLAEELEAIRVASGLKFEWLGAGSAGPNLAPGAGALAIDPTTGQPLALPTTETNAGLFVLREPTPTPETVRTVEAFNIGPYLHWLREKQDPKAAPDRREQEVAKSLDELEKIVAVTLESLKQGSTVEVPSFRFHRGANLLIVTGTRDAVEVARKVVNALPGQAGLTVEETGPASGYGIPGMDQELARRYGLLVPTAPPTPAPPR